MVCTLSVDESEDWSTGVLGDTVVFTIAIWVVVASALVVVRVEDVEEVNWLGAALSNGSVSDV